MRFLDYAPILHISALTGERAGKVLETIDKVAAARRTRVPTPALNRFVAEVTAANPPVSPDRAHVRILYAAQVGVSPPRSSSSPTWRRRFISPTSGSSSTSSGSVSASSGRRSGFRCGGAARKAAAGRGRRGVRARPEERIGPVRTARGGNQRRK